MTQDDLGQGSVFDNQPDLAPPSVERFSPPKPEDLKWRMEDLASTLHVLNGMSRRGGVLPEDYRAVDVPAIRRFANRIFDALETGTAAKQPWDHDNGR